MSLIFFEKSYISVFPSYSETEIHKHNMLHVFFGKNDMSIFADGKNFSGNIIFLEQNVLHKAPEGFLVFFLFVDPTSFFATQIREKYLKGENCATLHSDEKMIFEDILAEDFLFSEKKSFNSERSTLDEESVIKKINNILFNLGFALSENNQRMDSRITNLVQEIDSYKYLGVQVSKIAEQKNYSESYLTHLFKKETGVALKNYLLMIQIKYVWQQILKGSQITTAVMDAGFSSSSHFSAVCKQMTGISVTKSI